MCQFLIFSLFLILFNTTAGKLHKYNPEIFIMELKGGVKYHVVKNVTKCQERVLIEQAVNLQYSIGYVEGENVISIGLSKDAINIVVGNSSLPKGTVLTKNLFF